MKTIQKKAQKLIKRISKTPMCQIKAMTSDEQDALTQAYTALQRFDEVMNKRKPTNAWRINEAIADIITFSFFISYSLMLGYILK